MAKQRKKAASKTVKKKWFSVTAPQLFLEQEIAECPANEITDLKGKQVKINLMTLTRDPKKQGITITFEVTDVKGDKAATQVSAYQILPSTIKKMVRRNKNRIDSSYKVKTVDGCVIIVKPFMLTRIKAKGSIVKMLRAMMIKLVTESINKLSYDHFIRDIVNHRYQKNIYDLVNKKYPVSQFEIRVIKVVSRSAVAAKKNVSENVEKPAPEKVEKPVSEKAKKPVEKKSKSVEKKADKPVKETPEKVEKPATKKPEAKKTGKKEETKDGKADN